MLIFVHLLLFQDCEIGGYKSIMCSVDGRYAFDCEVDRSTYTVTTCTRDRAPYADDGNTAIVRKWCPEPY